jgi:GH24 family phage-related lysozyme (muramidase)
MAGVPETASRSFESVQKAANQMMRTSATGGRSAPSTASGGQRPAPPASSSAAPATSAGGGGFFSKIGQMIDSGASYFRGSDGASDNPPEKETTAGGAGSMSEQDIKNMIIEHEGIRYSPYKDSLGLWTVGVGHLIGDGRSLPPSWNREFSHDEVMSLFDEDYKHHREAAEKIPGFAKLDTTGQGALTDLTFNMGPTWYKKWPRFSKAIEEGDTQLAALSLEQSKWYGQVGRRAPKIVSLVENSQVSAREGGIAKGPEKGYPATLHGNEIIVPLDPNSILAELGKKSAQQAMAEMKENAPEANISQSDGMKDLMNMNTALMELLSNKLDNMINKLDTSNDTQSKILKYSQA